MGQETAELRYTLSDPDGADRFTVAIRADPVYGSTIFSTTGGHSSCILEAETAYSTLRGLLSSSLSSAGPSRETPPSRCPPNPRALAASERCTRAEASASAARAFSRSDLAGVLHRESRRLRALS